MTSQKVYEFAKEIGVETLVLMDKIRKWGLPVKSHMADLSVELQDEIKEKLDAETDKKSASKKKTKKKAAKKKTAAKKTAKKKTAKKAAKKKVATKVVTKKTATADETKEVEVPVEETTTRKAGTTVIRRKKVSAKAKKEAEQAAEEEAKKQAAEEVAAAEVDKETKEDDASAAASSRKREVLMTEDGPVSGVRSAKRNIVGKMDLEKVRDLPQARQAKTANRNLRTGFVSQGSSQQQMPPEQTEESRFKDKKRRPSATPAPQPKERDKEAEPPSFVAADFKKRELVFQPKKKKVAEGPSKKTQITTPAAHKRVVKVYGNMSVNELAQSMGVKAPALIKVLMTNGIMANINTDLDFDTISLVAPEFKYEAVNVKKSDQELIKEATFGEDVGKEVERSPVVTVMGHVDHGKTTLLDSIRKARVAAGEAGGITQHIGAYRVKTSLGEVTFIDTPGHEAFTAMRARGAHVTDIVILVVAADDGVMPQTIEAINHSKAAGVPIIVAVNKMDKAGANPDRIKQQLSEYELLPEDWGGTTQFCPVSALNGDGIAELLEQVSLQAEMLELKGHPERSATGVVIESRVEKGRGNVATLLIKDGTLKKGQHLVIGTIAARARILNDETGKPLEEAGPSMPIELIGLPDSPMAGDAFDVCKDEKIAQDIADVRKEELRQEQMGAKSVSLEDLFSKVLSGDLKELPVVLKTDVAGSGEAIRGLFDKISTEEVKIKIIHNAVGAISESDVLLASTAKGICVGFNVRPDSGAQAAAKRQGVEIKSYSIVYELVDDMKKAMAGLLEPEVKEKVLGRAEVRETFGVPKVGTIAGCYVVDGMVSRNSMLRLVRDGKVVYEGKVSSLKRFKDDAKEVQSGYECGIGIENYNDIKVGDEIESFVEETIAREL